MSSLCQHPRFPPEILDCFIDSLAEWDSDHIRDVAALGACALVSRAFARRSRSHLFHQVRVVFKYGPESMSNGDYLGRLHEFVTWRPRHLQQGGLTAITPYIKDFSFDSTLYPSDGPWGDILSAILQSIHGPEHGITKLTLEFHTNWSSLALGLRQAINDLLLAPRLVTLCVAYVYHLPRMLLIGSHLKQLKLRACSVDAHEGGLFYSSRYPYATASYPLLELADVDDPDVGGTYEYLFQSGDVSTPAEAPSALSALQTLRWSTWRVGGNVPLFAHVQNTVEYIDMRVGDLASMAPPTFNLVHMNKLKRLRICTYRQLALFSFAHGVNGIGLDIRDVLQVPSSLRTFALIEEICSPIHRFINSLTAPDEVNEWSRLNDLFSSPNFARVTRVIIELVAGPTVEDEIPNTESLFEQIETLVRMALPYFTKSDTTCVLSVVVRTYDTSEGTSDDEI